MVIPYAIGNPNFTKSPAESKAMFQSKTLLYKYFGKVLHITFSDGKIVHLELHSKF
jgi:hypothetical protein